MSEVWRPIAGWEGEYEVSDLGNVRGIERISRHTFGCDLHVPAKLLTKNIGTTGYYRVTLRRTRALRATPDVHRLVAMAFIPNPKEKPFVNHIDADRLNNVVSNLEWCTHAENMAHMVKLGRQGRPWLGKRGVLNPRALLTADEVRAIRASYQNGEGTQIELARRFKTTATAVSGVVNGRTYQNVL